MFIDFNEHWIRKTIELAKLAKGKTSPNPLVGAVIVGQDGEVISEGFHEKAGTDHAEIVALKKANKNKLVNSTLYVNLEPCCHYGRTPPCTEAIIKADIKKVVIGSVDPNDKVSGKGIQSLKQAGIEVISGVLEKECHELNRFFFHWIKTQKPWVSLKIAATLNGKINIQPQRSWITGAEARKKVHELRTEYDVILTGSGTILEDDPQLTVRLVEGRNPVRVVLDRQLRCNENQKIFQEEGKNIVFTSSMKQKQKDFSSQSIEIIDWNGDLSEVFKILGSKNYLSVLVEAGNALNTSFIQSKLVDEILYFINPSLMGGEHLMNAYSGNFTQLKVQSVKNYGEDYLFVMQF